MFFAPYFSATALLVLAASLLLGVLLYLKNIKTKIVPVANLCSLLVFLASLVYAIHILSTGLDAPERLAAMLADALLMNLYAGVCNAAARVWARAVELMGNKRLKIKIQAEIVER